MKEARSPEYHSTNGYNSDDDKSDAEDQEKDDKIRNGKRPEMIAPDSVGTTIPNQQPSRTVGRNNPTLSLASSRDSISAPQNRHPHSAPRRPTLHPGSANEHRTSTVDDGPRYHINPIFPRDSHKQGPARRHASPPANRDQSNPTQEASSTLSSLARTFVRSIPLNKYVPCESFIANNPKILDTDLQEYVDEAVNCLVKNDEASRLLAFSWMEKLVILKACRPPSTATTYFKRLQSKDPQAVEEFKTAFSDLKKHCEKVAEQRRLHSQFTQLSVADKKVSSRATARGSQSAPQRQSRDSGHASLSGKFAESPLMTQRSAVRKDYSSQDDDDNYSIVPPTQTSRHAPRSDEHDRPDADKVPRNMPSYGDSNPGPFIFKRTISLDLVSGYEGIPAARRESFFRLGRVFAVMVKSNQLPPIFQQDFDQCQTRSKDGDALVYYDCILVVIDSAGADRCRTLPVTTYGGHGLGASDLTGEDVARHAIIHRAGLRPEMVRGEPQTDKYPIAVEVVAAERSDTSLKRSSRINFGSLYTIDFNVKLKQIGQVAPNSIPYFVQYAKTEINRHSETARETSGKYHPSSSPVESGRHGKLRT